MADSTKTPSFLFFAALTSAAGFTLAATPAISSRNGNVTTTAITLATDEILPPEIKTSLGIMPGVKELPQRRD